MIAEEQRGRALGAAASLLLHALVLLALAGRSANLQLVAPAREVVLEVTWWAGDEGQGAAASLPVPLPGGAATATPALAAEVPPPDGVSQSASEPQASLPARQVTPPNDAPIPTELPPGSIAELREVASDRTKPEAERALPTLTRRSAMAEMATPHPKRLAEWRDRPASRRPVDPKSSEAARIAEPASSESTASGGRPGAPGPRGNTGSSSELAAYLARVRARIASRQSALGSEQGRVGIRFDVAADGSLTDLVAISGDRGPLADEALRIVRRASPVPPIPPSLGRESIRVSVMIVFE